MLNDSSSTTLNVPERINAKLEQDQALHAATLTSIQTLRPWIATSTIPFFPEYTDHGLTHLQEVLHLAEYLVDDRAWGVITPADAAVFVISVLLHDCAMHITEDGFAALIDQQDRYPPVLYQGDRPWAEMWSEFMSEAKRFDGRKLIALFGNTRPVRSPPSDPAELTLRDRQLIGEFLRRHHHRLGHDIAINGVPGPTNDRLRLEGLPPHIADLAGIIARSHGQSLRSMFPILVEKYDLREFRGVHPTFLMVLLRVADYLQVHAERAPQQALLTKRLKSPLSKREWDAHSAVLDIRQTHDDPEAVFIHAQPEKVTQYLKIRDWQAGIQAELDVGWAVLGEVYGRVAALSGLGLKLRRVRSNLDDAESFAKSASFIPVHAAFDTAGADLLKLLVAPLYGDYPAVGIRELVQNAVDAVRELREHNRNTNSSTEQNPSEPDVLVSLERDEADWWLSVVDRGIGMRAETITKYFLRAGASFRRSLEWQGQFEDEHGHSKVLRSGRFGVGALAAFLLGDEIIVRTRHVADAETEGVEFSATIATEALELRRATLPSGTSLKIKLSEVVASRLTEAERMRENITERNPNTRIHRIGRDDWDWFCLDDPQVVRAISGNRLPQAVEVPSHSAELPVDWHRVSVEGFSDVHWTFSDAPMLVVNGIEVRSLAERSMDYYYARATPRTLWPKDSRAHNAGWYGVLQPNLSVFDPDGIMPLTLQRTALSDDLPFRDELLQGVVYDLIAFLVVHGPTAACASPQELESYLDIVHLAIGRPRPGYRLDHRVPLFSTPSGFGLADTWSMNAVASTVTVLSSTRASMVPGGFSAGHGYVVLPEPCEAGSQAYKSWIRYILGYREINRYPKPHTMKGRRVILPSAEANELNQVGVLAAHFRANIIEEASDNGWTVWAVGDCPSPNIDIDAILSVPPRKVSVYQHTQMIGEWYLADSQTPSAPPSPIEEVWKNVVGSVILPYNRDQRLELYAGSTDLKPYIAKWLKRDRLTAFVSEDAE